MEAAEHGPSFRGVVERYMAHIQPDGTELPIVRVESDDLAAAASAVCAAGDVGFRFFSRLTGTATVPGETNPVPFESRPFGNGPAYRVGRPVSPAFVDWIRHEGGDLRGMTDSQYADLLARSNAHPGARILERNARDGRRVICLDTSDSIVVDAQGRRVTETVDAPAGWACPTVFSGSQFTVIVHFGVLTVRVTDLSSEEGDARVDLVVRAANEPRPLERTLLQAAWIPCAEHVGEGSWCNACNSPRSGAPGSVNRPGVTWYRDDGQALRLGQDAGVVRLEIDQLDGGGKLYLLLERARSSLKVVLETA